MNRQEIKDITYLRAAHLIASLSKDKNTHIGAKIISKDGTPVSEGRNGSSALIPDSLIPLSREVETLDAPSGDFSIIANKYPFMIHAEENALLFTQDRSLLIGATIYVTHIPCPNCASKLSQCGITRVVWPSGASANMTDKNQNNITRYIFEASGIEYVEIEMDS